MSLDNIAHVFSTNQNQHIPRKEETAAWYNLNNNDASINIIGDVRMGKTSIGKALFREAHQNNFLPIFEDLSYIDNTPDKIINFTGKEMGFRGNIIPSLNKDAFEEQILKTQKKLLLILDEVSAVAVIDEKDKTRAINEYGNSLKRLIEGFDNRIKIIQLLHFPPSIYNASANSSFFYRFKSLNLLPITLEQTTEYLKEKGFDELKPTHIYRLSGGVPYMINQILHNFLDFKNGFGDQKFADLVIQNKPIERESFNHYGEGINRFANVLESFLERSVNFPIKEAYYLIDKQSREFKKNSFSHDELAGLFLKHGLIHKKSLGKQRSIVRQAKEILDLLVCKNLIIQNNIGNYCINGEIANHFLIKHYRGEMIALIKERNKIRPKTWSVAGLLRQSANWLEKTKKETIELISPNLAQNIASGTKLTSISSSPYISPAR